MAEENRYQRFFDAALAQHAHEPGFDAPAFIQQLLERLEAKLAETHPSAELLAEAMKPAIAAGAHVLEKLGAATPPPQAGTGEKGAPPVSQAASAPEVTTPKPQPAGTPGFNWLKWAVLLAIVVSYSACLFYFLREGREPARGPLDTAHAVALKLDITVADFGKEKITFNIKPTNGTLVETGGQLSKDITLEIDPGTGVVAHTFKAHVPVNPWTLQVSIDTGDILDYPFDRYLVDFNVWARSGNDPISIATGLGHIPHGLTAALEQETVELGEDSVRISVSRSGSMLSVVLLSVVSLILVSISACAVAWHVVFNNRKIEFGMMVWTAALLFVVPSVRNALPGSAPTGATIDFLVFFWLQAMVAVAMASLVISWIKRKGT